MASGFSNSNPFGAPSAQGGQSSHGGSRNIYQVDAASVNPFGGPMAGNITSIGAQDAAANQGGLQSAPGGQLTSTITSMGIHGAAVNQGGIQGGPGRQFASNITSIGGVQGGVQCGSGIQSAPDVRYFKPLAGLFAPTIHKMLMIGYFTYSKWSKIGYFT